jgi:acyl CoA:acetate/3-ketoacid CoA transferase beta subunit
VDLVVTNLAAIEVTAEGLVVREVAPGVTFEEVQEVSEPRLIRSPDLREMEL